VVVVLIVCAIIGYRLTNRFVRRTYQAYVALEGKEPFADPQWNEPDAVVLYRTGRNGVVCFDGFHSKDLHDHLAAKTGLPVTVEYDTFTSFGTVTGYNVHSVNGMVLANGYSLVREDFGGTSGSSASRRADGTYLAEPSDCW
jgi:hypothetical protein